MHTHKQFYLLKKHFNEQCSPSSYTQALKLTSPGIWHLCFFWRRRLLKKIRNTPPLHLSSYPVIKSEKWWEKLFWKYVCRSIIEVSLTCHFYCHSSSELLKSLVLRHFESRGLIFNIRNTLVSFDVEIFTTLKMKTRTVGITRRCMKEMLEVHMLICM